MPNTPAAIGRGVSGAFADAAVTPRQHALAEALLAAAGTVEWVDHEALIDAVTAVSGSGPAYVFYLAECLAAAGVEAGGRTGLTAVFVGILFLVALFFSPLAGMIPSYASAAALLFVACVMASLMANMEWDDITESAPAVIAAITARKVT